MALRGQQWLLRCMQALQVKLVRSPELRVAQGWAWDSRGYPQCGWGSRACSLTRHRFSVRITLFLLGSLSSGVP